MPLFTKLVSGTGFARFMDFVSPAFFDVMPAGKLAGEARSLVSAYRDKSTFQKLAREKAEPLSRIGVRVEAEGGPTRSPLDDLDEAGRQAAGQAVLRLYFHQLIEPRPTLLDLSRQRFTHEDGQTTWRPGRGHIDWDDDFQRAIVDVYRGFYKGGEHDLEQALSRLDLETASDLFRKHFGDGEQTAVRFSVDHFVDSFHQVFVHCKKNKIRLHPDFLGLGVYLATLYETLEALAVPLNVREAFLAVDA